MHRAARDASQIASGEIVWKVAKRVELAGRGIHVGVGQFVSRSLPAITNDGWINEPREISLAGTVDRA